MFNRDIHYVCVRLKQRYGHVAGEMETETLAFYPRLCTTVVCLACWTLRARKNVRVYVESDALQCSGDHVSTMLATLDLQSKYFMI